MRAYGDLFHLLHPSRYHSPHFRLLSLLQSLSLSCEHLSRLRSRPGTHITPISSLSFSLTSPSTQLQDLHFATDSATIVLFHALLCMILGLAALVSTGAVAPPSSADGLVRADIVLPRDLNTSDESKPFSIYYSARPATDSILKFPDTAIALGYDPSTEWHDYSTVQVWMGKDRTTVGNKVGFPLYTQISSLLYQACRESDLRDGYDDCDPTWLSFDSICLDEYPDKTVKYQSRQRPLSIYFNTNLYHPGTTWLSVAGRWYSQAGRRNLIIAAAGAFQAWKSVSTNSNSNCWHVDKVGKTCNIGDVVRVSHLDAFQVSGTRTGLTS